jgi:F0F1-type ATP synthase epsilon subunit
MSAMLRFTVLTPDGPIIESEAVQKVRVRLADSSLLSVYPYHAPLMAETLDGDVLYMVDEQEKHVCLRSGIFFVHENVVTIHTGGKMGDEPSSVGAEVEEKQERRFDRLAAALMSTLRAHPQRIADEYQVLDSEPDGEV